VASSIEAAAQQTVLEMADGLVQKFAFDTEAQLKRLMEYCCENLPERHSQMITQIVNELEALENPWQSTLGLRQAEDETRRLRPQTQLESPWKKNEVESSYGNLVVKSMGGLKATPGAKAPRELLDESGKEVENFLWSEMSRMFDEKFEKMTRGIYETLEENGKTDDDSQTLEASQTGSKQLSSPTADRS
jgi:hypothetical protein